MESRIGERIIVVVRSAEAFASQDEVDASCGAVMHVLDAFGRSTGCVLMDTRLATGRNDPDFDGWFARYRRGMLIDFRRSAVLVQSAVGRLHADRLLRLDEQPEATMRTFSDEDRALDWLRGALV